MDTKKFFCKLLIVLSCGFGFSVNTQAQDPAISQFPYTADFGTTENPGADNTHWRFKAFNLDGNLIAATQWSFAAFSNQDLGVCFTQDDAVEEQYKAAFTPIFHLEQGTSYSIKVMYSTPVAPTRVDLFVRLHSVKESGEPYYKYPADYMSENLVTDADGSSIYLQGIAGVPQGSSSEYTYFISPDQIPQTGDYRVAFILERGSSKAPSNRKMYITALSVESITALDLAAGQIISPYTDPNAGTQHVSAFVFNRGGSVVNEITACYRVDNSEPVKETFSDLALAPDKVCRITFKQALDIQQSGNHTITFWVDDDEDTDHSNDTTSCSIKTGNSAIVTLPAAFNFTDGWTMHSDSIYAEPAWGFVKEGNKNFPYASADKPGGIKNNDYLISPLFRFEKDTMYRIEFVYKAVLQAGETMGDKSLSLALYVCRNADRDALSSKELVWKQDRFDYTGDRRMVVYYRAGETASRTLAFRTYGPSCKGGLQLQSLSVSQAESNTVDYFFGFEGTDEDPQYLVEQNLDFVDYDGNVDGARSGIWELYNGEAFNSSYSARSVGLKGKTDDWMIFKPFYLEAGKDYYLSFRAKINSSQSDDQGLIEYYVQNTGPRYDLAYEDQPGVKGKKTVHFGDYDTVYRVFTVSENGYYLLSIRNATNVPLADFANVSARFSMFVDNISLADRERNTVQVIDADVPYEARLGQRVRLRMTVRNFSLEDVSASKIKYCYQIDNDNIVREIPIAENIQSQVSVPHDFRNRVSFTKEEDQTVKFWVEMEGADEIPDTISIRIAKIKTRELPFVESFAANSMEEWNVYPASRQAWQMQYGTEAHSPEYAVRCRPGNSAVADFLVSPLLQVEKEKTYRVSFFTKRGQGSTGANDSLILFYAYNRYDNSGFSRRLAVFPQPFSSEYVSYLAYVRFPDSGNVFLGLEAKLAANTAPLYIDDFMLMDSAQSTITYYKVSDLRVSGEMSECDTSAHGTVSFKITAGGFSTPETVNAYIRYDEGSVQDISFRKEMLDGEDTVLTLPMPMFSGGNHKVRVWIGLPDEADRSDDTVSASFRVNSPQAMPFQANNIRVTGSARMTTCFEIDSAATYSVRYFYDATEAEGASMRLNLLQYGENRIVGVKEVDAAQVSGKQTVEKAIEVSAPGVYAFGIECSGLPSGGLFLIDSIRIEKKLVFDTVEMPVFSPAGGEVASGSTVSITCATQGATSYYTTNGTTPTENSMEYTEAIVIDKATTVKAFAVKDGMVNSAVAEAVYTVKSDDTTAISGFAAHEFRLQPNPAGDFVEVIVPEDANQLYIFDMQGRVCRQISLQRQKTVRLDLNALSPGVYTVRVTSRNKASALKLIKR